MSEMRPVRTSCFFGNGNNWAIRNDDCLQRFLFTAPVIPVRRCGFRRVLKIDREPGVFHRLGFGNRSRDYVVLGNFSFANTAGQLGVSRA